jgi:hypothetical protein
MNELRKEAKEKGINSFGMNKETLQAALGEKPKTAGAVRRTPEDATKRAEQIRNTRRELGIDPTQVERKFPTAGQKAGWTYRWAVNKEGRIMELERKGYQIDESISPVSAGDNSGGQKHIRMMIPETIHNEDFAKRMGLITQKEKALTRADVKGGLQAEDGAYGDITIGEKSIKLGSTQG